MIPHKCPCCNGHQTVSKPPNVAGDQLTWYASDAGPYQCKACIGTGIVWEQTGSFLTMDSMRRAMDDLHKVCEKDLEALGKES